MQLIGCPYTSIGRSDVLYRSSDGAFVCSFAVLSWRLRARSAQWTIAACTNTTAHAINRALVVVATVDACAKSITNHAPVVEATVEASA
jgi:hypothetical protein